MGKDEFYDDNHVEKVLEDSKISRRNASFFGVMGF
jgi:WD40 repeat protein